MQNDFFQQKVKAMNEIAIISRTDKNGIITFVNENFCKVSGFSEAELLGQNHRIVNSGFHSKHFFLQMWKDIQAHKPWRGLIRNKTKSGDFYWVDSYIVPLINGQNEVSEFISFRFDVTAEKIAEVELEKEKMKNIHMSRLSSIGEMAAGVAHEINNPLAVMQGHLFLIERQLKSVVMNDIQTQKINESIEKSLLQIKRMTKIVNGLRDFSRSNEEQNDQTVSCTKLIETVQDLCAEKIKKNQIQFDIKTSEVDFKCNQLQIEQVLINLIHNAADAIEPLTEKWIHVEAEQNGLFVEIAVTDSGAGISKEIAQKIMQPFFTTKEIGKGTGLGLSISKDIIESHGGTLQVDSDSKNTKFIIQLPLDEGALISLIDQDEAIKSHLDFKNHSHNNSLSATDTFCHLGKWIQKVAKRFKDDPLFLDLKAAHTEFHRSEFELLQEAENQILNSQEQVAAHEKLNVLSERVVLSLQKLINEKQIFRISS